MKKLIIICIALVFILNLTCCGSVDPEPVISAVNDFMSEENFNLTVTVKQSYTQDGKVYDFEKKYLKFACDTVSGSRYYEQSGTITLNGEEKGQPYASFYPPLTLLTLNNSFSTGVDYDKYIESADQLFWRINAVSPASEDIKGAKVSKSDGKLRYDVKKPCDESVAAVSDYIEAELEDVYFSYTLCDGKLASYTQNYKITGDVQMDVSVTVDINATGDGVEIYDDTEFVDKTDNIGDSGLQEE